MQSIVQLHVAHFHTARLFFITKNKRLLMG